MRLDQILMLLGAAIAQGNVLPRACNHDNCLRAFLGEGSDAVAYCSTYASGSAIPDWAVNCGGSASKVMSACACVGTPTTTGSSSMSSSTVSASPTSTSMSSSVGPTSTTSSTTMTSASSTTSSNRCSVTAWTDIAPAVKTCMDLTLNNIVVPTRSGIVLTALQTGAAVTFQGNTSFEFSPYSGYKMVQISGNNIHVKGAPGSFFDGGGPQYWDGQGNGGSAKPGNFMKISLKNNSVVEDLYVLNTPTHAIDIDGVYDSVVQRITVNNSLGDAPNAISGGKSAAHNTDAFDLGLAYNFTLRDCTAYVQDDCVALSESNGVTISGMYCEGSHGLSIAGGGSDGPVIANVLITDSFVTNSSQALRIKTDYNSTGVVANVTYSNIAMSNIHGYGIDIQQDYYNGGSYGMATNGVKIQNLTFSNITGTTGQGAADYYVLCGKGSCSDWTYKDVLITGGTVESSCNYPWSGCPNP